MEKLNRAALALRYGERIRAAAQSTKETYTFAQELADLKTRHDEARAARDKAQAAVADLDWQSKVKEFHEAFACAVRQTPGLPSDEIQALRRELVREEAEEMAVAVEQRDLVGIADAAADLVYVVLGTCVSYGIELAPIFAEVHRSNMTKLPRDGKPVLREDGKVQKPVDFEPPRVLDALRAQGMALPLGDLPTAAFTKEDVEAPTALAVAAVTEKLTGDVARAKLAAEASEGVLAAVVSIVGGSVEGAPTHRGNVLQRLRELVAAERGLKKAKRARGNAGTERRRG